MSKFKILYLLLITNIFITSFFCYKINKSVNTEMAAMKTALLFEPNIIAGEDKKFRENVYKALGMLMSGQGQLVANQEVLSVGLLRIHHFVEPHADKFYSNCPECQKEKSEILKGDKSTGNEEKSHGRGI